MVTSQSICDHDKSVIWVNMGITEESGKVNSKNIDKEVLNLVQGIKRLLQFAAEERLEQMMVLSD